MQVTPIIPDGMNQYSLERGSAGLGRVTNRKGISAQDTHEEALSQSPRAVCGVAGDGGNT